LRVIPKLAEALAHPLDSTPKDGPTFVRNANGSAMKPESFTNWFHDACLKAGVPGSAHGLRKAAATRLAEAGASEKTLQAVFGWTSPKQAQNYTKAADTRQMGMDGSRLFERIATQESRTTR
ncbi:MAG: tyrosine-type recombinase/integrase, partial [Hyphomonadaceae bacterium]